MRKNHKSLVLIIFVLALTACTHVPAIKKPVEKEQDFSAVSKTVWNESVSILVKSGYIIKTLNENIGLIIGETLLTPSQLAGVVIEGGAGRGVYGVRGQGKCIMNVLIKEKDDKKTTVFLNTRIIVETYSSFGGKLDESLCSSNGKIEESFFEKLSLALGEKTYDWLTQEKSRQSPTQDQNKN